MFLNRFAKKTDEELLRSVKEGEEKALTELYQRYSKPMLRYFHRMLWKDENKAQDFLHDLFVKIIERPEVFDQSRKFSTWFYSVAHNMCKNEYRKQSYREGVQHIIRQPEGEDNRIHEAMDEKQFMIMLDNAMLLWSEEDRSLFVLRHELEMTFTEIGLVLGCPEGTAKSRWFYLRKLMAEQFHEFQGVFKV